MCHENLGKLCGNQHSLFYSKILPKSSRALLSFLSTCTCKGYRQEVFQLPVITPYTHAFRPQTSTSADNLMFSPHTGPLLAIRLINDIFLLDYNYGYKD